MARVPTKTTPDVAVERGPVVFQNVQGSNDPDAFGAGVGRAISGLGDQVAAEGIRRAKASDAITRRQEAVARVQLLTNTENELDTALRAEQDGENFGSEGAITNYRANVERVMQKAQQGAQDQSVDSQLQMQGKLIALRDKHHDIAISEGLKGQEALVDRQFEQQTSQVSQDVFNGLPPAIAVDKLDDVLDQYVEVKSPSELAAMRDQGMEAIGLAGFNQRMNLGEYGEARKSLSAFAKFIGKDALRGAQNRLIVGETKTAAEDAKSAAKLARIKRAMAAIGQKMTPQMILAAEGINLGDIPKTKSEKIQEVIDARETAGQPPLTPSQLDKLEGVYIKDEADQEAVFGKGAKGRAAARVAKGAPDFASGRNDPEEDRLFITSVSLLTQRDPVTGQPGTIGPITAEALRRRGIDPDNFKGPLSPAILNRILDPEGAGATEEALTPIPEGGPLALGAEAPTLPPDVENEATPVETSDVEGAAIPEDQQPDPVAFSNSSIETKVAQSKTLGPLFADQPSGVFGGGKTIFEMGEVFTGVIPALKSTLGRTPFIGRGGGVSSQVRTAIPLIFNRLVNALRVNVRSETERQNLLSILSVDPKIFDNKFDFQDRMLGVDTALKFLGDSAAKGLATRTSLDQQKRDIDLVQLVTEFRSILMPPRIEGPTEEQVEKSFDAFEAENPPGTRFLMRDRSGQWKIFTLPEPTEDKKAP